MNVQTYQQRSNNKKQKNKMKNIANVRTVLDK